jgi:nitrate reductase gamma subunit
MAAFYSFMAVLALVFIAAIGAGSAGMYTLFGVAVPYIALLIFLAGFIYRIVYWAKSPVPFSIATTGGQQKSLPWIKNSPWDNPYTVTGTVIRMILEVATFRSLFRNTKVDLRVDNVKVAYGSAKFLWLFALIFHMAFFTILIRHMRLFLNPVPVCIQKIEFLDSILQVGIPTLYQTDLLILVGLAFLLLRRIVDAKVNYISLAQDYFPLFLLLGIAISGIYMRYFVKADVISIKELTMGLLAFKPKLPDKPLETTFFVHLFLVSCLLAYFPFSKLMHLAGVFLSPTRNLPNNTRRQHYTNPWNDPAIKPHSYEAYENDFREKMIEAGLPVEKEA